MRFHARCRLAFALLAYPGLVSAPAIGQDEWHWPEKMKNAQVFPKDFPAAKLSAVMRGFTRSLGVRCTHCHVGEEGKPLGSYDFVSDKNPNKDRAREMYRMLGDINGHLKKITPSAEPRVNMWCGTCHRGRPRPTTLGEEMSEARKKSGIEGALARYRELRGRYEDAGAFDFRERTLADFAGDLVEEQDYEGAIAVLKLNAEVFPKSSDAWEGLGEAYRSAGKNELAVLSYRKALELDARNDGARQALRELEAPKAP